jgi:hypothetical protein
MIKGWNNKADAEAHAHLLATPGTSLLQLLDETYVVAGPVYVPKEGGRDRVIHGIDGQTCSAYEITLARDFCFGC